MEGAEGSIDDCQTLLREKVFFHEVTKEGNGSANVLLVSSNTQLSKVVQALNQKLSFLCDEATVWLTRDDFSNLVENEVLLDKPWSVLVNLTDEYMLSCLNSTQIKINWRVDAHALAPNIDLLWVCQGDAVIETAS